MQDDYNKENLIRFLNECCEVEQVAIKQYDHVLSCVQGGDLKQQLSTYRDECERYADAFRQVIQDIGGEITKERTPFVEGLYQIVGRSDGGGMFDQLEDVENLLTIEQRHRTNVECLRVLGEAIDDPRLKGAAEFLQDGAVDHVSWLSATVDEMVPLVIMSTEQREQRQSRYERSDEAEERGRGREERFFPPEEARPERYDEQLEG